MPTPQLRHFAKDLNHCFALEIFRSYCLASCLQKGDDKDGGFDCQAIKAEEELTIAASKIDVYSRKESFACQSAPPFVPFPTPHPIAVSPPDFAGRRLV